jgi:hypothetical protein
MDGKLVRNPSVHAPFRLLLTEGNIHGTECPDKQVTGHALFRDPMASAPWLAAPTWPWT